MAKSEFFDLFIEELQDIYSAEKQLVQALPNVASAASDKELKEAITKHLGETKDQVQRLDKIFRTLNENPGTETCEAMQGLIKEAEEVISAHPASPLRDAAIIAAAQKVEHYEVASYGTLRTFAKNLELDDIADILQTSLNEEGNANKKLTSIAEGGFFTAGVNQKATNK